MKKIYLLFIIVLFFVGFSGFAYAQVKPAVTNPDSALTNNGSGVSVTLLNPLAPKGDKDGGIRDIPTFVKAVLGVVMKIGVPLVALAIIYTGYLFIAAQGNEKKLEEAKQAIVWVFVGALILLGAYVIAQALQGTMNAIRGGR